MPRGRMMCTSDIQIYTREEMTITSHVRCHATNIVMLSAIRSSPCN